MSISNLAFTHMHAEGGGWERTQYSELYYLRIQILGICLFLQSVLANLHASMYRTTVRTLTTIITMTEMRERESNLMHSNRVQTLKIKISKF